MKSTQPTFKLFENESRKTFGGTLSRGNPRDRRPISLKKPMHLVMHSTLATGERSFLRGKRPAQIKALVDRTALKSGVKVYRYANSGNHIHLLVRATSRPGMIHFMRVVSGLIARLTLGAERGNRKGLKFWDARPFTRIVEWGRDFSSTCRYLLQNTLEALGFIPYQQRSPSLEAPATQMKRRAISQDNLTKGKVTRLTPTKVKRRVTKPGTPSPRLTPRR